MASTVAPPAAAPAGQTSAKPAPAKPPPSANAKKLSEKTLTEKEVRWDKRLAWFGAFLLLVVVVGLWGLSAFVIDKKPAGPGPQGDTVIGYVLAGITLGLYGLVAAYSWRHRRRRQKRFMTRTWMEVHIAFGMVAGVAAILHSGPRFPMAPFHAAFLGAWLLLIFSGIFGKLVSVIVPKKLTRIEDEALLAEDVAERQRAMRTEIEQLLQASDEKLISLANDVIPPKIKSPGSYGKRRLRRSDVVAEVYAAIDGDNQVPADKRDTLKRLVTCLVEEKFLDKMMFYHFILRAWVPAHVALTTLCFPWLILHIVSVLVL
jgi:hypothetical protein